MFLENIIWHGIDGSICFGCRVVNVPLQYIERDLLFAGRTIIQGRPSTFWAGVKVVIFQSCAAWSFAGVPLLTRFLWCLEFTGFVVSVSLASAFLGCALSGTIADAVGRRRAFQISSLPMILGAIIRYFQTDRLRWLSKYLISCASKLACRVHFRVEFVTCHETPSVMSDPL